MTKGRTAIETLAPSTGRAACGTGHGAWRNLEGADPGLHLGEGNLADRAHRPAGLRADRGAQFLRDEGAARRCKRDQARRDIDAVTQEIAVFGDRNVAEVPADADLRLAFRALVQELEDRGDRFACGGELHHDAVARGVEDAPAVPHGNRAEALAQGKHLAGRNGRIALSPRRIAGDIDADDRRKTNRGVACHSLVPQDGRQAIRKR